MEENYQSFFNNSENLESIYNMLKGEEKELKRDNIKKLIQMIEGTDYEDTTKKLENESTEDEQQKDVLTFDEFKDIFQKIYKNSHEPRQIFMEGFLFLDKNKYVSLLTTNNYNSYNNYIERVI